ncbi:MAG: SprB repeat-containing protein [Lewinellaceae bacterium]|nr:SprB repeat-containing protein [Phaeodactylibacter sp.]MCB9349989.1 SprB repeat-containing protein [Lewinellaceae bacterium]
MKCALSFLGFLLYLITASASGAPSNLPVPSAPATPLSLDTIALDTTICVGDSVQLQLPISGATNIQWQAAAFLSCSDCPDPVTEPLFGDQLFTVTGLDGQGNPFSYEYNIYIRNYLDFGLLPFSNSPLCEGDTLVFYPNVVGAQSYTWANPSQAVFSTAPFPLLPNVSQADAGTYSLDLIDDLGCQAGATFDVIVRPAFTVGLSITGASCNGLCDGAISLDISGGTPPYQVSWDQGLNWSPDTELAGLCTGTHPVWVMDENCLQKLEAIIEEAEPLGASFNISSPNCPGDDIIIEIYNFTGGAGSGQVYFYSVDGGLTFQPTFDVQWQIPASTTSIVIADDAGCQSSYPINVVLPEPIQADIRVVNASCISLDDGSITISVSGGTPPYSYFFNNDLITTSVVSPIDTGVYYVEIVDVNGCSVEREIAITTSPIDAMANDTVICAGEQALLRAEAPGAVGIQWTPATGLAAPDQLTTLATPSETTTYVLTVEDDEGCLGTDSVQVAVLSGLPCREEWRDTLVIGQSGQWCSVASMFGSPIPYGITALGCGLGYVGPDVDSLGLCIGYRALEPGQDTLCLTICELLDTATCWEAWLYLTVTETLVRPGDTDSSGMADQYDLLNIGLGYGATGPLRPNASLDWQGQPAPLWAHYTPTSGVNYRHIDTNGDGLVSTADTLALSQNWGLTWEEGEGRPSGGSPPLAYRLDAPFYLQPDTLIEGAVMQLPLILGSEDAPATGVYGLAFSLYFDEAVVKDGAAALVLADSWLGSPTQNLIYMQRLDDAAGRIDIGITRIDGIDAEGYGPIGDLFITIEDDILAMARDFSLEARFEIRDVRIISYAEEPLLVATPPTVSPVLTAQRDQPLGSRFSLFPNPATQFFYLLGEEVQLDAVQLLNVLGQPVRRWERPEQGKPLSLQGITPGLHLVKAQAGAGVGAWWLVVE